VRDEPQRYAERRGPSLGDDRVVVPQERRRRECRDRGAARDAYVLSREGAAASWQGRRSRHSPAARAPAGRHRWGRGHRVTNATEGRICDLRNPSPTPSPHNAPVRARSASAPQARLRSSAAHAVAPRSAPRTVRGDPRLTSSTATPSSPRRTPRGSRSSPRARGRRRRATGCATSTSCRRCRRGGRPPSTGRARSRRGAR